MKKSHDFQDIGIVSRCHRSELIWFRRGKERKYQTFGSHYPSQARRPCPHADIVAAAPDLKLITSSSGEYDLYSFLFQDFGSTFAT